MNRTAAGYLSHKIQVGQRGRSLMLHSEACAYMQVAGKYMDFELLDNGMVQLFVTDEQTPRYSEFFSSPITAGEAGVRFQEGEYYYMPHGVNIHADELASVPPQTPTIEAE